MRWKDLITGVIISLIATVLGGIIVYYVSWRVSEKREHLTFSIRKGDAFQGANESVSFTFIDIANGGELPSREVRLNISYSHAEIKDFKLRTASSVREIERKTGPRDIHLTFESFVPGEHIALDVMTTIAETPSVNVRSSTALAAEVPAGVPQEAGSKKPINLDQVFFPLSITALAALLIFSFLLRRFAVIDSPPSNRNNAAFLILHQGLVLEASNILEKALLDGHYDSYTLSNLALCKALNGDIDRAKKLIDATKLRKSGKHAKAVCLFNEAIIYLSNGEHSRAYQLLSQSLHNSPKSIRSYIEASRHFDSYRDDPALVGLLTDTK